MTYSIELLLTHIWLVYSIHVCMCYMCLCRVGVCVCMVGFETVCSSAAAGSRWFVSGIHIRTSGLGEVKVTFCNDGLLNSQGGQLQGLLQMSVLLLHGDAIHVILPQRKTLSHC